MWLALDNGQAQGKIGAFWSTGCVAGASSGLNIPPTISSGTPPKDLIVLPPISMNVDNEVYARTRSTSQSYIKRITSSAPEIATGTEWGTNEVKIRGKKPGTTTISFVDDNTGTIYLVDVTVNDKPKPFEGGDGRAESKPIDSQPSHCLIGTWRSVSGEVGPRIGGAGVILTIKPNGEATADYSNMQDLTDGTYYIKHSGRGTAFIKFDDSLITVEREGESSVRFQSTNPGGRVGSGATTALGPIIDPFGKTVDFTCKGNSLVFEPASKFSKYTFERIQ